MSTTPAQLATIVLNALAAQPNLQVFDGEPDSGLKCLGYMAGKTSVAMDGDGRAHIHAALYMGPGKPDDERAATAFASTNVTFQVTAVGGDQSRCLLAIEKVKAALHGLRVGDDSSLLICDPFDPGAIRVDRDPSPSRSYLPLIFRVSL